MVGLVIDKYLKSLDFNGLAITELERTRTLRQDIETLIRERGVDMVRGDGHPNPHIKAFSADKPSEQLAKIATKGLGLGCLYPTPETLARVVRPEDYRDRPFTLELALGAAQLEYRAFDLRSLEYYRNDPRFEYRVDDIRGSIIYKDEHFNKDAPARDQLVMDRFGFCYSDELRRAVAVFLRDLHKLDGEQQQHWKGCLLKGKYKLHPDYYRTSVLGEFPEGISIFDAFLEEKHQINIMCGPMGRAPLFRSDHKSHDRPHGFGFLIRPTQKELRTFQLLLDQLMSDDLNRDFFHDIEMVEKGTTASGKVITATKGTIQALEEWIGRYIRFDSKPKDEMLKTFREIRKLRQKPAHKHEKDAFDEKIFERQRELIISAYAAMRTLRLMLANDPAVRSHKVPDWLQKANLWTR
ncbi:MAG: AAA family ATPase [Methylocystis sp.]|nr:MAG: AAA family ATPase [Methylocystis sp.]